MSIFEDVHFQHFEYVGSAFSKRIPTYMMDFQILTNFKI